VHIDDEGEALNFCTLEALQNVQKYAAASAVEVRMHEHGGPSSYPHHRQRMWV
jgi:hypothetical protein